MVNVSDTSGWTFGQDAGGRTANRFIEAEDLGLTNYGIERDSDASGGEVARLTSKALGSASLDYVFDGEAGTYDLEVCYLDESDGQSTFEVFADGILVASWVADADDDELRLYTLTDLNLAAGAEIEVRGTYDDGERVRLDFISFSGTVDETPVPPAPEDQPEEVEIVTDVQGASSGTRVTGRVEVDQMTLQGFELEARAGASDGQVAKVSQSGGTGTATYTFAEASGTYDITIGYLDEWDGAGTIELWVGGTRVGATTLDENDDLYRKGVFRDVEVTQGDEVQIISRADDGERGRIDYISFDGIADEEPVFSPPPPPPSGNTPLGERIEVEDMELARAVVEDLNIASNRGIVRVAEKDGNAAVNYLFAGEAGTYDLTVAYLDESDGRGQSYVFVDGAQVATWVFDGDTDTIETVTFKDIELEDGQEIKIYSKADGGEYGRLDYITLDKTVQGVGSGGSNSGIPVSLQVEIEDMALSGYIAEDLNIASDRGIVRVSDKNGTGSASYTFGEASGTYDLTIGYLDEFDGAGTGYLFVNGTQVGTWAFDDVTSGDQMREVTFSDIAIGSGDQIRIQSKGDGGEYGRVDFLAINGATNGGAGGGSNGQNGGGTPVSKRIQAEDMRLTNYVEETRADASGGSLVKVATKFGTGKAAYTFGDTSGTYDIRVGFFDERDGAGSFTLRIDGQTVGTWGNNANTGSFREVSFDDVSLTKGQTIEVVGRAEGGEYARLDYIHIDGVGVVGGGQTDTTADADGNLSLSAPSQTVTAANADSFLIRVDGLDADADAVIRITDGATTVTASVASNGQTSVDLSDLGSGTLTTTVTATDISGNVKTISGPQLTMVQASDPKDLGTTSAEMFAPYAEWTLDNPSISGNAYDLEAKAVFTHVETGEIIETGMFYNGDGSYSFRFSGTQDGAWTFRTSSSDGDLNGFTGRVNVAADPDARGFVVAENGKFAQQMGDGSLDAILPNYAMIDPDLSSYLDNPNKIQDLIDLFIVEHGFTGLHIPNIGGQWFDIDNTNGEAGSAIGSAKTNPDPETFRALEQIITAVHEAGGTVHFWPWGDSQRGQTPDQLPGGENGTEHLRLLEYIADRLGPIPGWTMGYGFDSDEWTSPDKTAERTAYFDAQSDYDHLLAVRSEGPNSGTDHREDSAWHTRQDFADYEHHEPDYDVYVAALEASDGAAVQSGDRFRVRGEDGPGKDYTEEQTVDGLWQATMAGGVSNIWGNLTNP
ncbi:MAG: DUF5060 domain-containing protein, partial [Pseudomonadota bacterium]